MDTLKQFYRTGFERERKATTEGDPRLHLRRPPWTTQKMCKKDERESEASTY